MHTIFIFLPEVSFFSSGGFSFLCAFDTFLLQSWGRVTWAKDALWEAGTHMQAPNLTYSLCTTQGKHTTDRDITFSERIIQLYILYQYGRQKQLYKCVSFSEIFPWNKIPAAVAERSNLATAPDCSQSLWDLAPTEDIYVLKSIIM